MKWLFLLVVSLSLCACSQHNDSQLDSIQNRIDSLQQNQTNGYRPGLGEFMSAIQVHHAKLWFAGKEANWELADFELGEIKETIDDVKKYASDRKEVKTIDMINPPLALLDSAIKRKDIGAFKSSFTILTATCNSCHKTNGYGFNEIKVPDAIPFSNQVFAPSK